MFGFMYHKVIITNLKENHMKKLCIALALIALFVHFTTAPASAQMKGKCVQVYFDWSGIGEVYNSAYVWFDANGTFIDNYSETGVWYDNKGTRVLIFDDYPHAFYAGKKTMGFMRNDETVWGGLPGLWYTKGTKKSNCEFVLTGTKSFQAPKGGPSPNSPE